MNFKRGTDRERERRPMDAQFNMNSGTQRLRDTSRRLFCNVFRSKIAPRD